MACGTGFAHEKDCSFSTEYVAPHEGHKADNSAYSRSKKLTYKRQVERQMKGAKESKGR